MRMWFFKETFTRGFPEHPSLPVDFLDMKVLRVYNKDGTFVDYDADEWLENTEKEKAERDMAEKNKVKQVANVAFIDGMMEEAHILIDRSIVPVVEVDQVDQADPFERAYYDAGYPDDV